MVDKAHMVWSSSGEVRRELRRWRAHWELHAELNMGWLRREFLTMSERPARLCVELLLCYVALLCLLYSWSDLIDISALQKYLKPVDNWGDLHASLWSVQATIAGLLYPIVLSFVTMFLGRRGGGEVLVHLYTLDSSATVAGLSSVMLLAVMAVQYVLMSVGWIDLLPLMGVMNGCWFAVNSVLTAFFLYRTIQYLRPEHRLRVKLRYALSVALPRSVQTLYSAEVLNQAATQKRLLAHETFNTSGPTVFFYDSGKDGQDTFCELKFRHEVRLVDVRIPLLQWGIERWFNAALKRPLPPLGIRRGIDSPRLSIRVIPGRAYRGTISLVSVKNGPPPDLVSRLLFRLSFGFRATSEERSHISIASILEEQAEEARQAAAAGDDLNFKRAYDELTDLILSLLEHCERDRSGANTSTFATLNDVDDPFNHGLFSGWLESLRPLVVQSVDCLPGDLNPIRKLSAFAYRFSNETMRRSPREIRSLGLRVPQLLFFQLGRWWTDQASLAVVSQEDGQRQGMVLSGAAAVRYEEALGYAVSGWENVRSYLIGGFLLRDTVAWGGVKDLAALHEEHLRETMQMLLQAVSRADVTAAEWLADVLVKWGNDFSHEHTPWGLYRTARTFDIGLLSESWEEVTAKIGLGGGDGASSEGAGRLQRGVLVEALKNLWLDVRLMTVEVLIAWSIDPKTAEQLRSSAKATTVKLLRGKELRPGDQLTDSLEHLSGIDYVESVLRRSVLPGYGFRLEEMLRRVDDLRRPMMLSSRIYSHDARPEVQGSAARELLLIWFADSGLPTSTGRQQLPAWLKPGSTLAQSAANELTRWRERQTADHANRDELAGNLLQQLGGQLGRNEGLQVRKDRANEGLGSMIEALGDARRQAIVDAQISDTRLRQLEGYASAQAFHQEQGDFPLHLFTTVTHVDSILYDVHLLPLIVRKGELTDGDLEPRASNEPDSWARFMSEAVAQIVLADVKERCRPVILPSIGENNYWAAFELAVGHLKEANQEPILILDHWFSPPWFESAFPPEVDPTSVARFPRDVRAGQRHGYRCHLGDVAVYVGTLPPGESWVIPKCAFEHIQFRRSHQTFVNMEAIAVPDDPLAYQLRMSFAREVSGPRPSMYVLRFDRPAPPSANV